MYGGDLIGNNTQATEAGREELVNFARNCNGHLEALQGELRTFAAANEGWMREQALLEAGKIDAIQQENLTIAVSLGDTVSQGGQNIAFADRRAGDNIMSS